MQYQVPLLIAGPTASGKSSLALVKAHELGGEVINLDPFQALEGMAILTAQPDEEERVELPHHLYGCLPLESELSAPRFTALVEKVVAEVQGRGRVPVLVTGSGLYLRAFTHGIDDHLPRTTPELQLELERRSLAENLAELAALDPIEAGRIDVANPRRVERALALCRMLGEPVSGHRRVGPDWTAAPSRPLRGLRIEWPREALWARIAQRAGLMFEAGVEAEVAALAERNLGPSASKVIGLDLVRSVLAGEMSRVDAIERLTILTRQYAKRQASWFGKEVWMERMEEA